MYFLPSAVVTTFHFVKSCDRFKGAAKVAGPRFQNSSSFFFFMFVLFFFFKVLDFMFFFPFSFFNKKIVQIKTKNSNRKISKYCFLLISLHAASCSSQNKQTSSPRLVLFWNGFSARKKKLISMTI